MQNRAIAQRFALIADMLEVKGESIFRINAYRRAARAVEALTEDIAAVARRGELTDIPGIGTATSEKIEEFLKTGTMKAYEELAASLPPGLTTLMSVPEIGPKTALLLHERLGRLLPCFTRTHSSHFFNAASQLRTTVICRAALSHDPLESLRRGRRVGDQGAGDGAGESITNTSTVFRVSFQVVPPTTYRRSPDPATAPHRETAGGGATIQESVAGS